ncbi:hypothetical protein LZ31DRAFT_255282 [Colletotrichum somersetense]|nr:hypothetical protein LZ31DRAFT_255282 [Colletotrichum somersetense]
MHALFCFHHLLVRYAYGSFRAQISPTPRLFSYFFLVFFKKTEIRPAKTASHVADLPLHLMILAPYATLHPPALDCHLICPGSNDQLRGKRRKFHRGINNGCELDEPGFAVACTASCHAAAA